MMLRAVLLLLLLAPFGTVRAEAALFEARAPGVTAFLLGSVHVMEAGLPWKGAAIQRAFDASSECWFELDLSDNGAAVLPQVLLAGLRPWRRLSDSLSPEDQDLLRQRVEAMELPGGMAAVNVMRPWLAWMTLAGQQVMKGDPDAGDAELQPGADFVLAEMAKRAGKTVVGLETPQQQIAVVAGQDEEVMLSMLHDLLHAPPRRGAEMHRLLVGWADGDLGVIGGAVDALQGNAAPALADALLIRRNAAWADLLSGEKDSGATVLVTVGAGHLVGPGNLREQLEQRGWTVRRVN